MALPSVVQAQDYLYTTNDDNTINIVQYTGSDNEVIIPGMTNGLPVTSIGDQAFYYYTNLTSVTIPDSVTNIGSSVFVGCRGLTNAIIGTSVAGIGDQSFAYCTHLAGVTIPGSVTSIGSGAFYYCTGLKSVTIPDSVTNIGEHTFYGCTSLTNVIIGNSVAGIGGYAFMQCTGLAGVTIPGSVTNIGDSAFNNCTGLRSVTIGTNNTSIGDYAFFACDSLAYVCFLGGAPADDHVGPNVFLYADNATVYCLPGTSDWVSTFGGRPVVLWNPQVGDCGVRTNQFGFTITATNDLVVVVEACTNLVHPGWLPLETSTLAGGSSYFGDAQWTNYPARFYSLRMP